MALHQAAQVCSLAKDSHCRNYQGVVAPCVACASMQGNTVHNVGVEYCVHQAATPSCCCNHVLTPQNLHRSGLARIPQASAGTTAFVSQSTSMRGLCV